MVPSRHLRMPAASNKAAALLLLALLLPSLCPPSPAQADECEPWHWYVYYNCDAPGVWCKLHLATGSDSSMQEEGTTILGTYRLESEALSATCGAMGEPFPVGGPTAIYPGIKADLGEAAFDVGELVMAKDDGTYTCRKPQPDQDQDGVPDTWAASGSPRDQCPGTPAGSSVDRSGCPCEEPAKPRCGNGTCETTPAGGAQAENCESCPEDCPCAQGSSCSVKHPDADSRGCVPFAARIVGIGCKTSADLPTVFVLRNGAAPDSDFIAPVGTYLHKGDRVTFFRRSQTGRDCKKPYLTIQWSSVVGTVYLVDAIDHELTIGDNAVDSGWPTWTDTAEGGARFGVIMVIRRVVARFFGTAVSTTATPFVRMAISPDRTAPDVVKIYAKSHLVISQSPSEVVVHTLEGEATVDDGQRSVTVPEGMKASVVEGQALDAVAFAPAEIEADYRADPLTMAEDWALEPEDSSGPRFDVPLGAVASAAVAGCCGLAVIGLVALVLAMRQRSRRQSPGAGPAVKQKSRQRAPDRGPAQRPTYEPAVPWGRLTVTGGPAYARSLELVHPSLTIGRSAGNDLVLPDNRVSRHHALIERRAGSVVITDLDSSNGTYVNNRKVIDSQPLHPGAFIRMGNTELVFHPIASRYVPAPELRTPVQASSGPRRLSLAEGEGVLTIGRELDCDVVLADRYVSRHHAQIRREPMVTVITDLGSTHGTYVNGKRIGQPTPLRPGDVIRVGNSELVF